MAHGWLHDWRAGTARLPIPCDYCDRPITAGAPIAVNTRAIACRRCTTAHPPLHRVITREQS